MKKSKLGILILIVITTFLFTGCGKQFECVGAGGENDQLCIYYDQNITINATTVESNVTPKYRAVINVVADKLYYTWQTNNNMEDEINCVPLNGTLNEGSEGDSAIVVRENIHLSINTTNVVTGDKIDGTFTLYSNKTCTRSIAKLTTKQLSVPLPGPKSGLEKYGENYYILSDATPSNLVGMETEDENTPPNCKGGTSCSPNCACYSWAYVQKINTGSHADYVNSRDTTPCYADTYGLNRNGEQTANAYKTAFKYIVDKLQATSLHVKNNNGSHWVTVVGVTKEAYNTYVDKDGNLKDEFSSAKNKDFKDALLILNQGSGDYYPLSTKSYVVDDGDTYGTPLVTPN